MCLLLIYLRRWLCPFLIQGGYRARKSALPAHCKMEAANEGSIRRCCAQNWALSNDSKESHDVTTVGRDSRNKATSARAGNEALFSFLQGRWVSNVMVHYLQLSSYRGHLSGVDVGIYTQKTLHRSRMQACIRPTLRGALRPHHSAIRQSCV